MSKINETNYPRRTQASYEDTDMLVIQESGGNTYTTRIEDLREDCQETLAPALNTMRENLATVEGSTASKAYAKGDFLVFGGRLCKAKTSIASGATLVLDTNIELDSVGDELSSLNSDLANIAPSNFVLLATININTTSGTIQSLDSYKYLYFRLNVNNNIKTMIIDRLSAIGKNTLMDLVSPRAAGAISKDDFYSDLAVLYSVYIANTGSYTVASAYVNANFVGELKIYGVK